MAVYSYTAVDSNGKEVKGTIEGKDEAAATSSLKAKGLYPTKLSVKKGGGGESKQQKGKKDQGGSGSKKKKSALDINIGTPSIPQKDLVVFTRQLAILLDAGLPLIRALRTLESQAKNKVTSNIIGETADYVESGVTFSEALANNKKSFNNLYINMVRAGESAGAMETVLDRLATFMEKTARITKKVKSAMIYPIVVITIATLVTVMLMVFIVPRFKSIFDDLLQGVPLPQLTRMVIQTSNVLMTKLHIVTAYIVGFAIFIKILAKTKKGGYLVDYIKFNMPLFGTIISKAAISRFTRTLGTLLSSGVPVLNALQIVRDTATNELVRNAIQSTHDAVKEGEGVAASLKETKVFPDMVISMMEVGEETGKMPEMLVKISDNYDEEVDNAVDSLTSIIEPLMIVAMALIVGTIVVGMFLPLIKIMQQLG